MKKRCLAGLMTHQYKKLPVTMKMWMQFNVVAWGLDITRCGCSLTSCPGRCSDSNAGGANNSKIACLKSIVVPGVPRGNWSFYYRLTTRMQFFTFPKTSYLVYKTWDYETVASMCICARLESLLNGLIGSKFISLIRAISTWRARPNATAVPLVAWRGTQQPWKCYHTNYFGISYRILRSQGL